MDNLYQVLGVPKTATQGEIKARYYFLVKAYHPDRYTNTDEKRQAEEELKKVNQAYEILGDENKRKEYDLSNGHSSSTNTQQRRTETPHSEPRYQYEADVSAVKNNSEINYCQGCGSITYTYPATYRKNIGMLFIRRYRKVSGDLCADCHESLFWNAFLTNLFLGWWGIISFFINPFLMIMNLYNYIRSWKIRRKSESPKSSLDFKLVTLLVVIGIAVYFYYYSPKTIKKPSSQVDYPTVAIPTIIPTKKTEPSILYSMDFSANDGEWYEGTTGESSFEFSGQRYKVTSNNKNEVNWSRTNNQYSDGILKVTVFGNSGIGKEDGYFITWRNTDPKNFYALILYGSGNVSIFKVVNDIETELYSSDQPIVNFKQSADIIYISFIKTKIDVFIGGYVIPTILDNSFKTGSIGLGIYSGASSNSYVYFDNLNIYTSSMHDDLIPQTSMPTKQSAKNNSDCTIWSNVSAADNGKIMCVYGSVRSSYYDDKLNAFVIIFSSDPKAFYFIRHGSGGWTNIDGRCIQVTGKVYKVNQTPYIEIEEDKIFYCN